MMPDTDEKLFGASAGMGFAGNHDLAVSNGNLNLDNSIADKSALIIIDIQNDFCGEGGSLAVPDSLEILSLINHLRETNLFDLIVRTRDWHPQDHVSFVENHPGKELFTKIVVEETGRDQIMWPTHCVQETKGAEYHPNLVLKDTDIEILKG